MSEASEQRNGSSLKRAFSSCSILLALLIGHLAAGLFLSNLQHGLAQIEDPGIRHFASFIHGVYNGFVTERPLLRSLVAAIVLFALIRQLQGRPMAWLENVLGSLLLVRCASQFLFLNLLLLAPMRAGALLLIQLVLFLPVITIAFGWLYLRLDRGARSQGRRHIDFSAADNTTIDRFDYFYAAALTLISFEPSGATATTRLMKSLFLLHGLVMLDLVALTLSRAIGLASSGG